MTAIAMSLLRRLERRQRRRIPLERRIADRADEMQRADIGISAIAALAAAEALELAVEHDGIRFDEVGFDEETLHWYATYETGPSRRPTVMRMPLEHATEATQRGVGSLN